MYLFDFNSEIPGAAVVRIILQVYLENSDTILVNNDRNQEFHLVSPLQY